MSFGVQAIATAFALVFAVAVIGKADAWSSWTILVRRFPAPGPVIQAIRFGIPGLEAVVVIGLFVDAPYSLVAAAALLGVFAVGVAVLSSAIGREKCNCFGAAMPTQLGPALVLRNAAMSVTAASFGAVAIRDGVATRPSIGEAICGALIATVLLLAGEYRKFTESTAEQNG
jgi:hypothetical protein